AHDVQLHHLGGQFTASIHITLPAGKPITEAHALAEAVDHRILTTVPEIKRVVVHVEPPE
ncbi:MAG: cation diffusion facilitator family transporter, partial [Chloroflexi bacterium]|nr:cation diffusion facilitator family transporter [Chloroflexota bacterium]